MYKYLLIFIIIISILLIYLLSNVNKIKYTSNYINRNEKENYDCGKTDIKSKYFPYISKCVKCKNVYERMMNRKPATVWPPPKYPPEYLINEYTKSGEIPIEGVHYMYERYSGKDALTNVWNKSLIDDMVRNYNKHIKFGTYYIEDEELVRNCLKNYNLENKKVAVIGSENPWIEAILTTKNPLSITTIEYGKIKSNFPLIEVYTPKDFAKKTLNENIKFDFVFSYSSLEHSGLGRYGDELEPDGDINAVEEIYCMLKRDGLFFLNVPFANKSSILWNVHRYYGPERLKYLMANFEQLEYYGVLFDKSKQGIIVFKKN